MVISKCQFLVTNVRVTNVLVTKRRSQTSRSQTSGSQTSWSQTSWSQTSAHRYTPSWVPSDVCPSLYATDFRFARNSSSSCARFDCDNAVLNYLIDHQQSQPCSQVNQVIYQLIKIDLLLLLFLVFLKKIVLFQWVSRVLQSTQELDFFSGFFVGEIFFIIFQKLFKTLLFFFYFIQSQTKQNHN